MSSLRLKERKKINMSIIVKETEGFCQGSFSLA